MIMICVTLVIHTWLMMGGYVGECDSDTTTTMATITSMILIAYLNDDGDDDSDDGDDDSDDGDDDSDDDSDDNDNDNDSDKTTTMATMTGR